MERSFIIIFFIINLVSTFTLAENNDIYQISKLFNISDSNTIITMKPKIKDIIRNHYLLSNSGRKLNGSTFTFLDSKYKQGFSVAMKIAQKFTHISPKWLKIHLDDDEESTIIEGIYDIDYKWIQKVKESNPIIKILPTITFDNWYHSQLIILLTNNKLSDYISKQLIDLAKKFQLDGFVIEIWTAFAAQQKYDASQFLIKIAGQLKKNKLFFMLLMPPPLHYGGRLGLFLKDDAERLAPYVHGFIVKTYDYSNIQRPGPNSPIKWLKECINILCPNPKSTLRKKLFMAINFNGYLYNPIGGYEIDGKQYISILTEDKPKLVWDELSEEHYIEYKTYSGRNRIFYPTLYSLFKRLKLFMNMNTALAISDLGAGLNFFSYLL